MATMKQTIVPHLWFDRQAREAAEFYTSVFTDGRIVSSTTLGGTPSGSVDVVTFELLGMRFQANSAGPMFQFNESISFMVMCETQDEIDYYWEKLAERGEEQMCGWLKDRYGLSWQIVPAALDGMMTDEDSARVARVTQAFLQMKKFDLAALQKAYDGD